MFYHAVLMNLRRVDAAFLARVQGYAERIRGELKYVRDYRFGPNVAARARHYGWCVLAAFDDAADHERYQVSVAHKEMKAFMAPHIAAIVVCDVDTHQPQEPR